MIYRIGIDIDSTTVKIVIIDENNKIIYKCYSRYLSQTGAKILEMIEFAKDIIGENDIKITFTGSAGQGVAQTCGFEFVQEIDVTSSIETYNVALNAAVLMDSTDFLYKYDDIIYLLNECEKPFKTKESEKLPNMYHFKMDYIKSIINSGIKYPDRKTIGMPLGLDLYEILPFWYTLWVNLGFNVEISDISPKTLYSSETICYPVKLIHKHIENLISKNISDIFYPCMTYNNCPNPEILKTNININFMTPYFDIADKRLFTKKFIQFYFEKFDKINKRIIKNAIDKAYKSQDLYFEVMLAEGERALKFAEENKQKLIVLCGRSYHIDPEINHGIDKIFNSFGCVIITEDIASGMITTKTKTKVLNQWKYHTRLYNSAEFVSKRKNTEFVQLVSIGCGIDAVTNNEIHNILEKNAKLCTQIKIDEINNLGAMKIKIRNMLAGSGGK
jgi:predicted nucleotide-binding protein (sugar kinase/HSP70/actin superfamily)